MLVKRIDVNEHGPVPILQMAATDIADQDQGSELPFPMGAVIRAHYILDSRPASQLSWSTVFFLVLVVRKGSIGSVRLAIHSRWCASPLIGGRVANDRGLAQKSVPAIS